MKGKKEFKHTITIFIDGIDWKEALAPNLYLLSDETLKQKLKLAEQKEDYESCAIYRDEINKRKTNKKIN